MTELTARAFDEVIRRSQAKPEMLIGAPDIARAVGLSEDTVRRLARLPGVPIYMPPGLGRYFARRSELEQWLRTKPAA